MDHPRAATTRLLLASALLWTSAGATGCGDDRRTSGGYRVVERRPDTGILPSPDAQSEPGSDGSIADLDAQGADAEGAPDATGEPIDSGSPPDVGAAFDAGFPPDVGFAYDAGFPRDAGAPHDAGFPRDAGFGPPDSGIRPDAGGQQTVVSITPGTTSIVLNLLPPVPTDPLTMSATLLFDNGGPGAQLISVTSASITAFILFSQSFQMGPAYNAPVGSSQHVVSKIAGTADMGVPMPATACDLPAIVAIELSNGSVLQDFATVTCVH